MPIKVLELELTKKIEPIQFTDGNNEYRILIRINKQLIGWLNFSKDHAPDITIDEIESSLKKQFGPTLVRKALIKNLNVKQNDYLQPEGISVIVCTRNRTANLKQCIQSLMSLSYSKYEIIIVDNAPSNGDTQQLASNFPVRYIREDRPGLNWARNRGILEANHNIIAFTDDDALVDRYWLYAIADAFRNKDVMGISGYVAPAELETKAQIIFEFGLGGMGHGFERRFIKKEKLSEKQLLWASGFGIGANMAFRRQIFEKIGTFDTALDVGTPSNGAGDIEFFHRLVHRGHLFVYEPSMLIWHYHRREYADLCKQVYNNGRSFGCYLINCFNKRTVNRSTIIKFFIKDWLFNWNFKNLINKKIPRNLIAIELKGMLTSPFAYRKTQKWNDKISKEFASTSQTCSYEPEWTYKTVSREE
jgi:glycosyltransferase involved in cell wall biosynthesis